jgi:DinB superfamily
MPMLQRDLHQQLRTESVSLHQRLATLARDLDPEQLVRRPTPSSWSVGEVLEHLCLADENYARPLATLLHRAHIDAGAAMRPWQPSLLGKFLVKALESPKKMKAPRAFRPGPTPRGGVVEDFLARDSRLLHRMDEATSLDWQDLRMAPPILPLPIVKLNVGDVFRVHVVHLKRHLAQIERVVPQVREQ